MLCHRTKYYLYFLFLITLQVFETNAAVSKELNVDLRDEYGRNKYFVDKVELPALIALSFFPELKHTKITFEYKSIKTTMATRPHIGKFLMRDRSYIIYINTEAKQKGAVSFDELGLHEQIGIIAHELSHIVDYENRRTLSLIQCGIFYSMFKHYHRKLERETDLLVVKKGLAKQLYSFSNYVLNHSAASDKYKEFKRKNYLLPEEIRDYL